MEGVTTLSETARLRDVFRVEGRWKSGHLFLTVLAQNGAVLIHGDDSTAENKDVIAVEDERGHAVVRALLAATERGGGLLRLHQRHVAASRFSGRCQH